MANIQQEYEIGKPFNTYTKTELSTNDWTWDYRILAGFRREDGDVISVGGETSFDTDTARLSGVWRLGKFWGDPLKIYFVGTGRISATVIEHNEELPLADANHPYDHEHGVFDSNAQPSASVSGFYVTLDYQDRISVILSCEEGTRLNRVYGTEQLYVHDYGSNATSSLIVYSKPFSNHTIWDITPISIDNDYDNYSALAFKTLSVHFTSGGILEYIPNKDTLNPDHPQD